MVRVGIVGISGFSGRVLLDILLRHKDARVTYVAAYSTTGRVDSIWPVFANRTDLVCEKYSPAAAILACDLVFLALPHTESMNVAGDLLAAGKRVIDLSADYRLKNRAVYKKWYHADHKDPRNLAKAVYGLPEIYRAQIKKAKFIANPGCYPTAALLALAPLVSMYPDAITSISIDAKSGVSGAGRKVSEALMYPFVNENFKAYRVLDHQHSPEISLYLSRMAGKPVGIMFVPHLLPVDSGILETIYVHLNIKVSSRLLTECYRRFYSTETFVRFLQEGRQPELRHVVRTNFCDMSLVVNPDGRSLVITSVIDNLVKGASGQAVQNMNIMCGFNETEGLL
ncbi:MAG: N-acetyl-gamma-glutamyl-phosphate reductase [Candidatus Omnitrophota bacterium]